jgi:putative ABC transport system permease protein
MNIVGSLQLGLIYAILALGIFVTFRVMNMPDLTVDGSFTLGLAVSAVLAVAGHPVMGLAAGFLCGGFAGAVTGLLTAKAGIHAIISGILTMTGLYSVNLFIMGGSPNISLLGKETAFSLARGAFPGMGKDTAHLMAAAAFCAVSLLALHWYFKTGHGLAVRATGDNEAMVAASSINADVTRTISVSIANAYVGFSGAILAQYQGYADINSGTGIIVVGLASVILGEVFIRRDSMLGKLLSAVLGAAAYRILIALALYLNFFPAYMLRFVSAAIVGITLSIPRIRRIYSDYRMRKGGAGGVSHNGRA